MNTSHLRDGRRAARSLAATLAVVVIGLLSALSTPSDAVAADRSGAVDRARQAVPGTTLVVPCPVVIGQGHDSTWWQDLQTGDVSLWGTGLDF